MKIGLFPIVIFCMLATGCSNVSQGVPSTPSAPHVQAAELASPDRYEKPAGPPRPMQQPKPQSKKHIQAIMPSRLQIPEIHLDALVEPVGVLANGQMGVPKEFDRVGVLSPWTKPGMNGNAVIAGHFDHYTGPAVFYKLRKLKPGDAIHVSDAKGRKLTFLVSKVESYTTSQAPLEKIFGQSSKAHLNLITCSGTFNKKKQEHSHRLVVFSDLVE